jgi:hypothetical protein
MENRNQRAVRFTDYLSLFEHVSAASARKNFIILLQKGIFQCQRGLYRPE